MLGVNHFLLCSGFMRAMMGIVDFELYYVISWCYEIFMGLFIHVLVPSICLFEAVPIIFKIKFVWFALEMVRQCFVLDEWISFSLWMAYEFENVRCWPKKKKKEGEEGNWCHGNIEARFGMMIALFIDLSFYCFVEHSS